MRYDYHNIPVTTFRIYDAWTKETLAESRDFDTACEEQEQWQAKRPDNEIELLAVICT